MDRTVIQTKLESLSRSSGPKAAELDVLLVSLQVFLKEKERLQLQEALNKEVMRRIITLQRWFRTYLIRLHFLHKRDASLIIQVMLCTCPVPS